ncbi:hypothetical protein DPMN_020874 [Dreissena polymorpha]|uniref:Uncharacterized protein n=1 Tax=Dreissena polymorpha TaxID=45954 RepID=A0A9D4NLS9_DREPO|nr:hypothetical protein DPMN_020874 [Dreissena polymorpha]
MVNGQNTQLFVGQHLSAIQNIVRHATVNGQPVNLDSVNQLLAESIQSALLNSTIATEQSTSCLACVGENQQLNLAGEQSVDSNLQLQGNQLVSTDTDVIAIQDEKRALLKGSVTKVEGDVILPEGFVAFPRNQLHAVMQGRPILKSRSYKPPSNTQYNTNIISAQQENAVISTIQYLLDNVTGATLA